MNSSLKNLLLSVTLIAVPAGGVAFAERVLAPSAPISAATPGLGDLSAYRIIVTDTQSLAATGDFAAAERRITDLETLWDQNAATLRQADRAARSSVEGADDDGRAGGFAAQALPQIKE